MRVADACPGVLRPHQAADGALIRLRLPGGRISAGALRRLAELAAAYGNGILQLTSRAGLQLRGLPDPLPPQLVEELMAPGPAGLGLIPSPAHERVRNIVCSPCTGLDRPSGDFVLLQDPGSNTKSPLTPRPGSAAAHKYPDLSPLVTELDAGMMADPTLADLGGRFLFVLDDGRGDVIDLTFDLGFQATGATTGMILVGQSNRSYGPVRLADAAPTLLRLARKFVAARQTSGAWHVRELPDWLETLDLRSYDPVRAPAGMDFGRRDKAAAVGVRLSRLTLEQAELIETISRQTAPDLGQKRKPAEVRLTPWRGLVLPGAADRLPELAAAGFITDDASPWAQLSACVGAPHCAKSRFDTLAIAGVLAALETESSQRPRTHIAGCERRCGAPATEHVDWFGAQTGGSSELIGLAKVDKTDKLSRAGS